MKWKNINKKNISINNNIIKIIKMIQVIQLNNQIIIHHFHGGEINKWKNFKIYLIKKNIIIL